MSGMAGNKRRAQMRAFLPLVWSARKPATTPPTIEPYSKLLARVFTVPASASVVSCIPPSHFTKPITEEDQELSFPP